MSALSIRDVSCVYPAAGKVGQIHALQSISLEIEQGEFVVALGASGCGKSTLLNVIAGFIAPTQGTVTLGDEPISGPGADRSVVFQKHALLPWLNVLDNVAFGLKIQGKNRPAREKIAREYIKLLGLEQFEQSAVYMLSGGMQQRVGIARALTSDPEILLMDEPLGALDALTRERAQELILKIWNETGKLMFLITHSVEEALFMGTRLIVMSPSPGRISHVFDLSFNRRYLATGDARAVKASPDFIALREKILQIIFRDDEGTHHE